MVKHPISVALVAAVLSSLSSLSSRAAAEPPPAALHHAPRSTARAGQDLAIGAQIDRPETVGRALLVYSGPAESGEVAFARSSAQELPYVAVIPASAVHTQVAYAIELESPSGERTPVFATRSDPHRVTVLDAPDDTREAMLLARLKGRRSVVAGTGEYVDFGTVSADFPSGRREVEDRYFRIEGSYTYRLLGTVAEFGLRAGAVRGRSLVPGEVESSRYDVGLNYGAPRVRVRMQDWMHAEGELLTSVTEVGFSVGGGGAVLLGDPYGSKLTLGVESIQVFGTRGYTRLDVVANRRLTLGPIVEVTNMPHADRAGVRLLGDAAVEVGAGFRVEVRAGYQARSFDSGGPAFGGGLAYAF